MTIAGGDKSFGKYPYELYHERFAVDYEYPVYFTRDVFARENGLLGSVLDRLGESRRHRVIVYVDAGVAEAHPQLVERIKGYFHERPGTLELCGSPEIIPGGESAKSSWERVRDVMWTIGNHHLDRQSFVVAVGGGSVLDMVGFATSLVHRGLRFVRMPTTVLAQCDAGVGVKNGMNEHGMKNFIGTFAPPFAVLNDFSFLPTLSERDWTGGLSEAFKVAIIKDRELFDFLCENADRLRARDQGTMETVVHRTAVLHLEHIRSGGDPFEFGAARPLDFGHWAAHKLESLSGYTIGHGRAVGVGIAIDSFYAWREGMLTQDEFEAIIDGMTRTGLPIWDELLEARTREGIPVILEGLDEFREHLGGVLTVTLPEGLGRKREVHEMYADVIEEGLGYLKARAGKAKD